VELKHIMPAIRTYRITVKDTQESKVLMRLLKESSTVKKVEVEPLEKEQKKRAKKVLTKTKHKESPNEVHSSYRLSHGVLGDWDDQKNNHWDNY
jgi:hypothetical protein